MGCGLGVRKGACGKVGLAGKGARNIFEVETASRCGLYNLVQQPKEVIA